MSNQAYNPFVNAQTQFDKVAEMLNLDQSTRDLLRQHCQELHFTCPRTPSLHRASCSHHPKSGPLNLQLCLHPSRSRFPQALHGWSN